MKFSIFIFLTCLLLQNVLADEDYYQVLGIPKDASNKEIRKAFKKLALEKHPDKNPDDPNAHENFVRITNIYEVLKDEDMRKKYDRYGEEGLKDDFKGGKYESWNFYKNEFGIYDDDVEVTTLDRNDFDAAVNSGEIWFVNFYSPRCSHCHELAPTWRKFAQEMEGIVNIGAMNCRDNQWTCSRNGIRSYPSLVLFLPGQNPIRFQGDRSKKELISFVMQYVDVEVIDLWLGNIDEKINEKKAKKLPWLVSFCSGDEDNEDNMEDVEHVECISKQTKMKLAGMLRGLANVADIDCQNSKELCEKLGARNGLVYFPKEAFPEKPKKGITFTSLDAREIYERIMKELIPGMKKYTAKDLKEKVKTRPALIFFEQGDKDQDEEDTSLKRLPMLLKEHKIYVGKIRCKDESAFCKEMRLKQDGSSVIAFKGKGISQFEVFHGRISIAELTTFAKDSVSSRVTTLNPDYFDNEEITNSDKPWFVDFFAPWCPPCRALLPEFRKASNDLSHLNFGTVDCTLFNDICNMYGVSSYPTTMLFNKTIVSEYNGHHNARGIRQFVEDLIDPPYEHLTAKSYDTLVQRRPPGELWIVDFYANWCGPCQQLLPEWRKMAKMLAGHVKVGAIDCAKPGHKQFCQRHGINSYPEIRLYPAKKSETHSPLYDIYNGWNRGASTLASWALKSMPNDVKELRYRDFTNNQIKDESAWVIDFYAPWCGHCHQFAPKFVMTSLGFKGRIKFGKVNCDELNPVCKKAGIRSYPSVKFYPPSKPGETKTSFKDIHSQEPLEITEMLNNWMKPYEKENNTSKKNKDEL